MPGKTRLSHKKKKKKKQVCQKPVITAIIQFDLICIIKVRYWVAVEATAIPCYYQICDLRHEHTLDSCWLDMINQY